MFFRDKDKENEAALARAEEALQSDARREEIATLFEEAGITAEEFVAMLGLEGTIVEQSQGLAVLPAEEGALAVPLEEYFHLNPKTKARAEIGLRTVAVLNGLREYKAAISMRVLADFLKLPQPPEPEKGQPKQAWAIHPKTLQLGLTNAKEQQFTPVRNLQPSTMRTLFGRVVQRTLGKLANKMGGFGKLQQAMGDLLGEYELELEELPQKGSGKEPSFMVKRKTQAEQATGKDQTRLKLTDYLQDMQQMKGFLQALKSVLKKATGEEKPLDLGLGEEGLQKHLEGEYDHSQHLTEMAEEQTEERLTRGNRADYMSDIKALRQQEKAREQAQKKAANKAISGEELEEGEGKKGSKDEGSSNAEGQEVGEHEEVKEPGNSLSEKLAARAVADTEKAQSHGNKADYIADMARLKDSLQDLGGDALGALDKVKRNTKGEETISLGEAQKKHTEALQKQENHER